MNGNCFFILHHLTYKKVSEKYSTFGWQRKPIVNNCFKTFQNNLQIDIIYLKGLVLILDRNCQEMTHLR